MDNFILNITKNYYSNFIYFADKNSFIRNEIENLFTINNKIELYSFINDSTLLKSEYKKSLLLVLDNEDYSQENKSFLLNYLEVKNISIKRIDILNNVLPFNYLNTLVIEKSLLSETSDFHKMRKEIKNLENFICDNRSNKGLNNLSMIIFSNNTNSGQYNRNTQTITLKVNNLNPSSLYHEFFHLLDYHLAKKYELQDLFSNKNLPKNELKLYNEYIKKIDNFIDGENRETFVCYYKKYFGKDFEKEIKSVDDVYSKLRNMRYLDFDIIINKDKVDYVDSLSKEIYSHVEYIKNGKIKPKRNLYAIFSDIVDLELPTDSSYIARTSEKLARIYQSSFPIDKESLFPLSEEKRVLTTNLLYVLNKEIKPLLQNSNSLSKIIELRENFNNDIKKGIQNAL